MTANISYIHYNAIQQNRPGNHRYTLHWYDGMLPFLHSFHYISLYSSFQNIQMDTLCNEKCIWLVTSILGIDLNQKTLSVIWCT